MKNAGEVCNPHSLPWWWLHCITWFLLGCSRDACITHGFCSIYLSYLYQFILFTYTDILYACLSLFLFIFLMTFFSWSYSFHFSSVSPMFLFYLRFLNSGLSPSGMFILFLTIIILYVCAYPLDYCNHSCYLHSCHHIFMLILIWRKHTLARYPPLKNAIISSPRLSKPRYVLEYVSCLSLAKV